MNISQKTQPGSINHRMTARTAALLSLLMLAGCALYERSLRPHVPPSLTVPDGQKLLLRAYARGVQIYVCETSPDGRLTWNLKAPEAMLFDELDRVIGSHYAGPTWELDQDGSKVCGAVLQRVPSPDAAAIPWLLLKMKTTEGTGQFRRVTHIQRVNTKGGLAPAATPTTPGQEVRVHYSAEYYFYREK